jgi:hypothetical protein
MGTSRLSWLIALVVLLAVFELPGSPARASLDPPCLDVTIGEPGEQGSSDELYQCAGSGAADLVVTGTYRAGGAVDLPISCHLTLSHQVPVRHRSWVHGVTTTRYDFSYTASEGCGGPIALFMSIDNHGINRGTSPSFSAPNESCSTCQAPPPSVGQNSCTNCAGTWTHQSHFYIYSPVTPIIFLSMTPTEGSWNCTPVVNAIDCTGSTTFKA